MVTYPYVPKGLVVFEPRVRIAHRYHRSEMVGPLPAVLYKVLPSLYARRLVDHGEMMWSTLTYFQHELDPSRGDPFEGTLRHFPTEGLKVTREERSGRPDHAEFTLVAHGNQFMVRQGHHVFIYSTTTRPDLSIGDASDRACVEIYEPELFAKRVEGAVARHRKARVETFIHDRVSYWSPDNPPAERWALPHLMAMSKYKGHSAEQEYRFAVGRRADVFDFENIIGLVVPEGYRWPRLVLDPQVHRMKLLAGPLTDCCRIRGSV